MRSLDWESDALPTELALNSRYLEVNQIIGYGGLVVEHIALKWEVRLAKRGQFPLSHFVFWMKYCSIWPWKVKYPTQEVDV